MRSMSSSAGTAGSRSETSGCVLRRRLASGPLTEVWHARTSDGRRCVAKFPAASWAGHRGAARLIEREWEFLERAARPGIVSVIGLTEMRTGPGLLTEYLPGGDLVPLAGSHPRHWAAAAREVARVLAGIHESGIVHRDVKPCNVLFDSEGRATLIDFALAMRVGETSRAGGGTPAYQSRRHRQGAAASRADDVHAFAAMVYELLCGELPFGLRPTLRALETPPRSPFNKAAALAEDPKIAALAEITQATLTEGSAEPTRSLAVFQLALHAIIRG
jgi:serine/threonine protein kinase